MSQNETNFLGPHALSFGAHTILYATARLILWTIMNEASDHFPLFLFTFFCQRPLMGLTKVSSSNVKIKWTDHKYDDLISGIFLAMWWLCLLDISVWIDKLFIYYNNLKIVGTDVGKYGL